MNNQRLPFLLILIGLAGMLLWSSIYIVEERKQAIVLRFGEIADVKTEPGLYFKRPFGFIGMDTVQFVEDRLLTLELEDKSFQVKDGRFYTVDAFLTYKISDPRQFRRTFAGNEGRAEDNMRSRLEGALRQVYGEADFNDALSEKRDDMMRAALIRVEAEVSSLGLDVVDVRVRRTDLSQDVSERTFERMRAEREQEAERLRAIGNREKIRIEAEADREAQVIRAEAKKKAEILRGEGDAERNKIFAESFSKDPEFFAFLRSMRAYQEGIGNSSSTMVLSPDSEFFRYFNDANNGQ